MASTPTTIRPAAVAGSFYPGKAAELEGSVRGMLEDAKVADTPTIPKAMIVPHAGYVYSGPVAATAFARILPAADTISRIILLGPCHRVAVGGLAVSGADYFSTPLGRVPVDPVLREQALALSQVRVFDEPHAQEHSLEVHLPFLQVALKEFTLVPLVVGQATNEEVAQVIDALWGGPETLIVVSSDLSHYLDYDQAKRLDSATCEAIEDLDPGRIDHDQACGRIPVGGLLTSAKRRGMEAVTLDLRNSGDTAGPRSQVVGYGAWVFTEKASSRGRASAPVRREEGSAKDEDGFGAETRALLDRHGVTLLHVAAASIEHGLNSGQALAVNPADHADDLGEDGACFVTLKRKGQLRGCIGSAQAHRPLVVDVAGNGFAAAFNDTRFAKLTAGETEGLRLSISVLSAAAEISFRDEADLLDQLRPGADGLIIEDRQCRSLFLPAVWDSLPDARQFLGHLKAKAGLAADHWSTGFRAWRFIAEEISTDYLDDPQSVWR